MREGNTRRKGLQGKRRGYSGRIEEKGQNPKNQGKRSLEVDFYFSHEVKRGNEKVLEVANQPLSQQHYEYLAVTYQ